MEFLTDLNIDLFKEIVEGLSAKQKSLPSKLFYDEKGSALFDKICRLDEYYPTRTELMIMKNNVNDIVSTIGKNVLFIEFGSGSSLKSRLLLSNLSDIGAYVPIDISAEHLENTAHELNKRYPELTIIPVAADYESEVVIPDEKVNYSRRVAYFPGSTIGNFEKSDARRFLKKIHSILDEKGSLLIGVDLVKERQVLLDAYNDSNGVTAEFNLNMLERLNNEFMFNFELSKFEHQAVFNEEHKRIEMYLVSKTEQEVNSDEYSFNFREGETILTEYSHKYTRESFESLIDDFFSIDKVWTDNKQYFGVFCLRKL